MSAIERIVRGCQRWYLAALVLTGCAVTSTRPDGFIDAFIPVEADAGADARRTPIDAYRFPDAVSPSVERCDGVDNDFDGALDESPEACEEYGAAATCDSSRACHCNDGIWENCNGLADDRCETPLNTDENCGACGTVCDLATTCRAVDREGGGFACLPAEISDFTLAREGGEIACFIRPGPTPRVICRGPNTDYAITNDAPPMAVLGWTVASFPVVATRVRAWEHVLADGLPSMTICILGAFGDVYCRGSNATGLMMGPVVDRVVRVPLPPVGRVVDFQIWGGEGIVCGEQCHIWGGRIARDRARTIATGRYWPRVHVGNQTFLHMQPSTFLELPVTWGPPVDYLGPPGWVDAAGDVPVVSAHNDPELGQMDCARDVCCGLEWRAGRVIRCWGARERGVNEETRILADSIAEAQFIRLFPNRAGHIEVCTANSYEDSVHCADATVAANSLSSVSPEGFHPEPLRRFVANGGYPGDELARVDWQALCVQWRPDWWQCWGTHDGWGQP